jgi:nucleoside phosphorylase
MPDDDVLRDIFGPDPIVGARALSGLLALGDEGENLLFSRPIAYPTTVQVTRRLLRYVASRGRTIQARLLARLEDQDKHNDSHAAALLYAGAGEAAAGSALYDLMKRGYDDGAGRARFSAWGHAGGSAWALWHLVKEDGYSWEKLCVHAYRGACASVARVREDDLGALEELITHEWRDGQLSEIGEAPDVQISNHAIGGDELWGEANDSFLKWRRGALADEVLRKWAAHRHWRIRDFGAQIVASLGFRRVVTPLAKWLRREPVPRVRASVLHALERAETPPASDALMDFFMSSGEGRAFVARSAWRSSKTNAKEVLGDIARGDGTPSDEALVSLARMGVRDARLLEAVESHDHYRRINAALALAYLRDMREIDRIAAMRREAATPLERLYLVAALGLLGKLGDPAEMHQELVAAAFAEYPHRVDIFFVHRFLQSAVREALAAGTGGIAEIRAAWEAEFEPLEAAPKVVTVSVSVTAAPRAASTPAKSKKTLRAAPPIKEPASTGRSAMRNDPPRKTDVLLVTVNAHETKALLDVFEQATGQTANPVQIDDRVYRDLGSINSTSCMHALSEMGTTGPGAALQTVDKGIRALRPSAVIFIGIAFGINEKRQAIGDILLSKQLRLYDLQRVGSEIILRGDKPHSSTWLVNYFNGFAQSSWSGAAVSVGVVLSGDKLVDNIDYRDQLLKLEPEAVGGEMEGAGLYVASHEAKVDWIVLKAICDWADGEKSKNIKARQRKAARNAAQFLMHALQQTPLRRTTKRRR